MPSASPLNILNLLSCMRSTAVDATRASLSDKCRREFSAVIEASV